MCLLLSRTLYDIVLFHVTGIYVFYLTVVLVRLSVPVQVIDCKDSSEMTYNVLMGTLNPTHCITHCVCVCVCVSVCVCVYVAVW